MAHNQRCRGSSALRFPSESFYGLFDQDFDHDFDDDFDHDFDDEFGFTDSDDGEAGESEPSAAELASLAILESSKPSDFTDGTVVVLFDNLNTPIVAVAIRGMPTHASEPIDWVVQTVGERFTVASVLLGQYRVADSLSDESHTYVDVESAQLEAWCRIALSLEERGVGLRDIVVCEPESWASVASYFARFDIFARSQHR